MHSLATSLSLADAAPDRCPLCGNANVCAEEQAQATGMPQPPCWCMQATIDPRTLDRIPAADRGRACICARCAGMSPHPPT